MGATYIAKRFKERRCGHTTKKIKPAAECILTLVGEGSGWLFTYYIYMYMYASIIRSRLTHPYYARNYASIMCLSPLIGEANDHGYFVASQDPELRSKLKKISGIGEGDEREKLEEKGGGDSSHMCTNLLSLSLSPGVPLLHIVRNTMVLEEPSSASQRKSEEVCFIIIIVCVQYYSGLHTCINASLVPSLRPEYTLEPFYCRHLAGDLV